MIILIQPRAKKDLNELPKDTIGQILKKLHSIKDDPLRHIERLKRHSLWKLRIGDYQAIIYVETKIDTLHVIKIGHRKNIYKQL